MRRRRALFRGKKHVGMGMRAFVERYPRGKWAALQVDVRNAFNCMDRSTMLRQCAEKTPAASAWLHWCYTQPCRLVCQGSTLFWSTRGCTKVTPWDPLASP